MRIIGCQVGRRRAESTAGWRMHVARHKSQVHVPRPYIATADIQGVQLSHPYHPDAWHAAGWSHSCQPSETRDFSARPGNRPDRITITGGERRERRSHKGGTGRVQDSASTAAKELSRATGLSSRMAACNENLARGPGRELELPADLHRHVQQAGRPVAAVGGVHCELATVRGRVETAEGYHFSTSTGHEKS